MKILTMYKCECCDSLYKYPDEALECEARHFDLTIDEYKHWLDLKENVKSVCWKRGCCQNEETLKAEDEAIQELLRFEEIYGLTKKKYKD